MESRLLRTSDESAVYIFSTEHFLRLSSLGWILLWLLI